MQSEATLTLVGLLLSIALKALESKSGRLAAVLQGY